MNRRHARPGAFSRRDLLSGLVAAPGLLLAACGEGRAGPGLLALTAPTLRVRLGKPRPRAELRLAAGSWEITGEGGRAFLLREGTALKAALTPSGAGIAIGGRDTGATALRVRPQAAFGLDDATYLGSLLVRREGAQLLLVGELDLETYVAGVIPNEAAPGATPATHRAQAVASRTYAYLKCTAAGADGAAFHVFDTESSQVYRGATIRPEMGVSLSDMLQRAAETRGVVLTWQSRPFPTYFASTCGGHTTEPATSELDPAHAAEPLSGVACGFCSTSPKYRWTKQVTDADLVAGLKRRNLPVLEPIRALTITQSGRGGWAKQLTVTYGPASATRTVPGTQFRSAAGLLSHHLLEIRRGDGFFEIDGAGWGHGVGMCQWGAFEMGKRGFSETDMLRAYYPGAAFTRVY